MLFSAKKKIQKFNKPMPKKNKKYRLYFIGLTTAIVSFCGTIYVLDIIKQKEEKRKLNEFSILLNEINQVQ